MLINIKNVNIEDNFIDDTRINRLLLVNKQLADWVNFTLVDPSASVTVNQLTALALTRVNVTLTERDA